MELQETGELLKVFYATIGKRPTKIMAWILFIVAIIVSLRYGIESVDWLYHKLFGNNFSWQSLSYSFILAIIVSLLIAGIAFALAIFIRYSVDKLQSIQTNKILTSTIKILAESFLHTTDQEREIINKLLDEAMSLKNPSIWTRLLKKIHKDKSNDL